MISKIQEVNAYGWATFPVLNKVPATSEKWVDRKPEAFIDPEQYSTGEYALILRPCDLIIDIDLRNFPEGRNMWKEFKKQYGLELIDNNTYIIKTGGGGYHVYFTKPESVLVRKHLKEWPGLDFLSGNKSAYVIGPESMHSSGNKYKVIRGSPSNIAPAPQKLLDIIGKSANTDPISMEAAKVLDFSNDEQNIARYREYLMERALPAIEGQSGDQTTFKVACRGRDFNLSPEKTLELMLEHYNPKCFPLWEPKDLWVKVANAYKYNEEPKGKKDPEFVFNPLPQPDLTETDAQKFFEEHDNSWCLNKDNTPKAKLKNAVGYLTLWKEISECLKYNELTQNAEIVGKLPWYLHRGNTNSWTDEDTISCKYYMAKKLKTEFPNATIAEAVYIIASKKSYHPIRNYLSHLKWDGVKRVDNWLTTYCKVLSSRYAATIGRKVLVAAVARIFKPGTKFDHALVLEGKQGIGKSRTVAILGGEWYGDIHIDPSSRDTVDAMRGRWFIEMSEMESLRGAKDIQALKAFISRTTDRVRLAYARETKDFPRQCLFIGTINPDGIGYFTDTTGNRRFWPVLCTERIDADGLKKDRDQLFAEAVEIFKNGEELFITSSSVNDEASREIDDRVEIDPWLEIIAHWAINVGAECDDTTTIQVYESVLNGMAKNITRRDQIRIGRALTALGWKKERTSTGYNYKRKIEAEDYDTP